MPLVLVHLKECERQLQDSLQEPISAVLAARSAHNALVTALTAVLAGTDSTGAMKSSVRAKWLQYLGNLRNGLAEPPPSNQVLFPKELLAVARDDPRGYLQFPLEIDDDDEKKFAWLSDIRDCIEHPKAETMLFGSSILIPAVAAGVALTRKCLDAVWGRLDALEQAEVEERVNTILAQCQKLLPCSR